ncbi:fatty acid biosynthesis transcriptional regulator, putative [Staphylococcus aureus]|nr:fatty acid biosynthesis transcriptional regulator, putative [Staphylococcus aureus]
MRGETLKLKKDKRREAIRQQIDSNPFITDHELSDLFQVSIQTIRLDRTYLNIPELRKRIKLVAEKNYDQIVLLKNKNLLVI